MAAAQPDLRRKKIEEVWDLHPKKLTCLGTWLCEARRRRVWCFFCARTCLLSRSLFCHLLVFIFSLVSRTVVEATGLMGVGKKGRASPWVNVVLGKRSYKTEEKKHNLNPSWMELFHL
jgi:C2 domain